MAVLTQQGLNAVSEQLADRLGEYCFLEAT